MGMFDRFYDASGVEWQTKAFGQALERWHIGDVVPGPPIDYQAEVIGGRETEFQWAFATICDGKLVSVGDERDERLPLRLYSSGWEPAEAEELSWT